MVVHCLSIASLTCSAADVLFELFKAGFNFPSRPIILDDPGYGKLQVSAEHRYPLGLTERPTLGLMKSSKTSNSRPSVSGDGINPQTVDISFCQGNIEDAIKVTYSLHLYSKKKTSLSNNLLFLNNK